MVLNEVEVLVGWTGLGQLVFGGLSLVSAALEVIFGMHHNGGWQEVVHNNKSNVFPTTLKAK